MFVAVIVLGIASTVQAAPINVASPGDPSEIYHFRVNSGSNSAGFGVRDTLTFGLTNVTPNGYGEDVGVPLFDASGNPAPATTGTATQNGVTIDLTFEGDSVAQNLYSGGTRYRSDLTGAWRIDLINGADTLSVFTPEVGDVRVPDRVVGMQLFQSGDVTAPTFQWTNVDPNADDVRVRVFDLSLRDNLGQAQEVYSSPRLRNGESAFAIPAGVLERDGLYTVQVETRIVRDSGLGPSGQSLVGASLSVNRTWFDFSTVDVGVGNGVYLPEVTRNSDGNPVFNFNNLVSQGLIEYYDPLVAVGYDYQVGSGNPFFRSVLLPEVGDNAFDLYLWDGSAFQYAVELLSGQEYLFEPNGVERFRIMGIEPSALVSPNDPTAFVTGLSFISDGVFTGTMTPVVANVPLTASGLFLSVGLAGLAFVARRRRVYPALNS